MTTTLKDSIIHWKKKLEKNTDEDVILSVIRKLSRISITLEILQETHIGKTIRNLSKRSDIVGEKALAVLKAWRAAFADQEQPTAKTSNTVNNASKKENINKKESSESAGKYNVPREKSHEKEISYKHKHKHIKTNSVHKNHSLASPRYQNNYINGDCDVSNSSTYNHLYTYEKNETNSESVDYDPDIDISEEYNPECPELYSDSSKFSKTKKAECVETYKPSSLKHKLSAEEETSAHKDKCKKLKTESHRHTDLSFNENKQKKENHTPEKNKRKDNKFHSSKNNKVGSSDKAQQANNYELKKSSSKKLEEDMKKNSSKSSKSKAKLKLNCTEEFTSSEARFEDCLGLNDVVSVKKKKPVKSFQPATASKKSLITSNKASVSGSQNIPTDKRNNPAHKKYSKEISSEKEIPVVPKPSIKLEEVDVVSMLPQIQPNYRPLPQRSSDSSSVKKKVLTNEDAKKFLSSRKEKTAVYSGRRNCSTEVPSLQKLCIRILIENIDAIDYMGNVPYFLLQPVLERCTPQQLFHIETYNPDLVSDTSELWEVHCKRDFRLLSPQENETWRELYLRAHDEQEKKLKSITANISSSMVKSGPGRQVKLTYLDSFVKPPRDVARRQAKNGTAVPLPVNHTVKLGASKPTVKPVKPIAAPAVPAIKSSSAPAVPVIPKKPKVAPLMAKTLKSMKQCFRR